MSDESDLDPAPIQLRISIDPEMGEIYRWLRSKGKGVRPRELIFLARLGFAGQRGEAVALALVSGLPAAAQTTAVLSPVAPNAVRQERDVGVAREFGLELLMPPTPGGAQAH